MLGHNWEALPFTPQELDDGQPELLLGRYVDTDLKAVPSDGIVYPDGKCSLIFFFISTTSICVQRCKSLIQPFCITLKIFNYFFLVGRLKFFLFFSFFFIKFYFPTVQQGGQVILTCIHYNYSFSPTISSVAT